ncbi:DUF995 domain-containing protein [Mesorhizobium amorphae]|uniref:DUF995 domain-containing protein n=1 Tax=Mesorhizobium amorphae TaxID=71433 RepID=UPI0021B193AF|nr:DUF995 domain-containing protein [Mesorhizobium amorphae]
MESEAQMNTHVLDCLRRNGVAFGTWPLTLVAFGLALCGGAATAAAEPSAVPAQARVMTALELHDLYRDKTWQWSDGAGRFQEEGRIFRAWSGNGANASWAEGRWTLTNDGQLCLRAVWHSPGGSSPKKTCFRHKLHDGTVYQKKEPSGAWYVFKHAAPGKDDEYVKLVEQDTVSAKVMAYRPVAQEMTTPKNVPLPTPAPVGAQ